jgi:3-oxoacyl-[acyl-carrier protein] reductase
MMRDDERFLAKRVALVTGSVGRGIGRSIALHLARAGADVVLNYGSSGRSIDRQAEIERLIKTIVGFGCRAIVIEADTRTDRGVAGLVKQSNDAFGHVDILVNNAGAPWLEQDFAEVDTDRWRNTLMAEVFGPAALISALLPSMRGQGWGRIINIVIDFRSFEFLLNASYGHRLRGTPYPFWIGKRARMEMVEQLAHAELRHGVTVNSVLPGIIEECSWQTAITEASAANENSALLAGPADVARIVLRLCSNEFRWVTGARIVMPGNLYSRIR